jgi:DNA-directed RNA polymerase subunit RPC12/RpoP
MKPSAITCPYCNGASLRRSRRKSWLEILPMAIGSYPFRCLDCNQRFRVSIWLVSRLRYAKCPKCLGLELTPWSRRHYRLSFWQNLLSTFGAHRYRCAACRYYFLSFRPTSGLVPAREQTIEAEVTPEELQVVPETGSAAKR